MEPLSTQKWTMAVLYMDQSGNLIRKPNTIHHEGLRLILSVFRTSLEAHEPSLHLRLKKLGFQYYSKIKSLPTNPAHDCIFISKQQLLFNQNEKAIKPFGFHMKPILKEAEISLTNIQDII